MAIPGLRPSFEVRAKVRIGEKGRTAGGKEYPKSTDYFLSDDEEFKRVAGVKPKELTILLPHRDASDNFPTGLEQWAGAMLVCYTKADEIDGHTAAFRKQSLKRGSKTVDLLDGFTVIGDTMGNDRKPVICRDRGCPEMIAGNCKPMGRLQFYLKGCDPSRGVFQLDTKSWNSIEKIEGFLMSLGDPRGRELTLRVEMWAKGTSKFPVITLEGGTSVEVNTAADANRADVLVLLHKALGNRDGNQGDSDHGVRVALAAALEVTNPGWREKPAFAARIREIGVVKASEMLLRTHGL
ncbi:MAG: hypothetical protein H0U53_00855 [Actinobacteria bacterium]|nr:hypothetical protein [Actinomycetota bacterium]